MVFENGYLTELNLNSMIIAQMQQSQISRLNCQIETMIPWNQDVIIASYSSKGLSK